MEQSRYARHLLVPDIGREGQQKLALSSVLVVGAGGLGSGILYALAAAGVGHICIMDADTVSLSNLNRQFLYTPQDIGKPKAAAARERLRSFNPEIRVDAVDTWLDDQNAPEFCATADAVVVAVDNLHTRYVLNRACCALGKPLIEGAVEGWYGRLAVIVPGVTPCLNCLYGEERPMEAHTPGSVGAMVMTISAMQAVCALRVLLDRYDAAFKMLYVDGAQMTVDEIAAQKDPNCPVCGKIQTFFS